MIYFCHLTDLAPDTTRNFTFFSPSRYRNTGGFDIIGSGRDKIETPEQFKGARDHCAALELDGLVVIGGDDSNTNACLLAENFAAHKCTTRVVGCPKTIDADLKNEYIPVSFGFDTACKVGRPRRPGVCVMYSTLLGAKFSVGRLFIRVLVVVSLAQ